MGSSPLHCAAVKGGSRSGLVMLFTLWIFLSICCLYKLTGCISREEPSRFVRDEVEQKAANPGPHLSPLLQARLRKRSEVASLGPGSCCGGSRLRLWCWCCPTELCGVHTHQQQDQITPCCRDCTQCPCGSSGTLLVRGLSGSQSSALTSKVLNLSCVSFTRPSSGEFSLALA